MPESFNLTRDHRVIVTGSRSWGCITAAEAHGIPVEIIAPKEAA